MKNKLKLCVTIVAVMLIGFSMTGCATDPSVTRGGWSEYTFRPSSEYVVVGTVVVTNGRRATLLADLMSQALKLGAHDIINVRIGTTDLFGIRIRGATAVAIRYTNEMIRTPRAEMHTRTPYTPVETNSVEE